MPPHAELQRPRSLHDALHAAAPVRIIRMHCKVQPPSREAGLLAQATPIVSLSTPIVVCATRITVLTRRVA